MLEYMAKRGEVRVDNIGFDENKLFAQNVINIMEQYNKFRHNEIENFSGSDEYVTVNEVKMCSFDTKDNQFFYKGEVNDQIYQFVYDISNDYISGCRGNFKTGEDEEFSLKRMNNGNGVFIVCIDEIPNGLINCGTDNTSSIKNCLKEVRNFQLMNNICVKEQPEKVYHK